MTQMGLLLGSKIVFSLFLLHGMILFVCSPLFLGFTLAEERERTLPSNPDVATARSGRGKLVSYSALYPGSLE